MAIVPTPLHPTKTRGQQLLERQIGEPIEQALHRLYVVEGKDQHVIGALWGKDRATISRWLRDFSISRA
jgi:hypothetical protein